MMHRKNTQAFTLLELIVVVSIIGMLASIAVVTYSKIQSRARRTRCQKNLNQLVSAVTQYAGANRSMLPPHQMSMGSADPDRWWGYDSVAREDDEDDVRPADIWDYAGGTSKVFECPAKVSEFEMTPRSVSYGYNAWFMGWSDGGSGSPTEEYGATPLRQLSMGSIQGASSKITFGDSVYHSGASKTGSYVLWYPDMRSGDYDGVDMAHGDRGCVVFFDGHTGDFETEDINPVDGMDKFSYWDPVRIR
jgi:prepilin-type N-terminal cleavage/methylation domain-containing protein